MINHRHDTPLTRALLVGWIFGCALLLIHQILRNHHTAFGGEHTPPAPTALLAAAAVAVGAAVIAHAYRGGHGAVPAQGTATASWTGAVGLAAFLPIATWNGWPVPAVGAAAMALSNAAWWTFGFAILAMGATLGLARILSAQLCARYPQHLWPAAHGAVIVGSLGITLLLVFPLLPPLTFL